MEVEEEGPLRMEIEEMRKRIKQIDERWEGPKRGRLTDSGKGIMDHKSINMPFSDLSKLSAW